MRTRGAQNIIVDIVINSIFDNTKYAGLSAHGGFTHVVPLGA